jgi:type II secretory pathway component GspD/PulD (secretin)
VLPKLQALLEQADPVDPTRVVPDPTFVLVEESNGLLVRAESTQFRIIQDLVSRLDVVGATSMPPLRLLQLRTADAANIARLLQSQYSQRTLSNSARCPSAFRPMQTRTHSSFLLMRICLRNIKTFVDTINKESATQADRVTEIFPLKIAKAPDLAKAMNLLYPEPPVPVDYRGRPMPWAREPREVQISYDEGSNSIIVDAPSERIPAFQALVEKLDRIELPDEAELKTYPIQHADIATVSRTLQQLASSGALSGPSQSGRPRVPVSITAEPVSNTLIVTGDASTFAKVEQLLAELQAVPIERELRIVQISNADPQEIADRAQSIYGAPDGRP